MNGLDDKDRVQIIYSIYLSEETNLETFKQSLDLLTPRASKHKHYQEIGYV